MPRTPGDGLTRSGLLVLFTLLVPCIHLAAADQRGGSLSVEPSLLMPMGPLGQDYGAAAQADLDFDLGINPGWSMIFGAGYTTLPNLVQKDNYLTLAPAWIGLKSKAQFRQDVEIFWDLALEGTYAKEFYQNSGSGSIETLDGGGVAGAGFDLWLSPSLLIGTEVKAHLVVEGRDVYPFLQWGLRLGLRG
jgi:hypothetical protein